MTLDDEYEQNEQQPDTTPTPVDPAEPVVVDSRQLMRGRREVQIRHGDRVYRLRITSNGKLILNR